MPGVPQLTNSESEAQPSTQFVGQVCRLFPRPARSRPSLHTPQPTLQLGPLTLSLPAQPIAPLVASFTSLLQHFHKRLKTQQLTDDPVQPDAEPLRSSHSMPEQPAPLFASLAGAFQQHMPPAKARQRRLTDDPEVPIHLPATGACRHQPPSRSASDVSSTSSSGGSSDTSDQLDLMLPVDDFLLSSEFGMRGGRLHKGVDLAAHTGAPVVAAQGGRVTFVDYEAEGYGNVLEVEHPNGWRTLYAHNHANLRQVGDRVEKGELIALVGETGHATGPHLHWEVRDPQDRPVNPGMFVELGALCDCG